MQNFNYTVDISITNKKLHIHVSYYKEYILYNETHSNKWSDLYFILSRFSLLYSTLLHKSRVNAKEIIETQYPFWYCPYGLGYNCQTCKGLGYEHTLSDILLSLQKIKKYIKKSNVVVGGYYIPIRYESKYAGGTPATQRFKYKHARYRKYLPMF